MRHTRSLVALHAATGISAVGGAVYALAGAPAVPTDWLKGSPFRSYAVPGAVLGTTVAGSQLLAALTTAALVLDAEHTRGLTAHPAA